MTRPGYPGRGIPDKRRAPDSFEIPRPQHEQDDPSRAHAAVYGAPGSRSARLGVRGFLSPGERFRAAGARDPFGKPVLEETCGGDAIEIPAREPFTAYLLLKG